jgi:hypothetical protein
VSASVHDEERDDEGSSFTFPHARNLFLLARDQYVLTDKLCDELAPDQTHALIAIILSAATLEAFINELRSSTRMSEVMLEPAYVSRLHQVLIEADEERASTVDCYLRAAKCLPGPPFANGDSISYRLSLLFALRNHLLHARPQTLDDSPHKLILRLQSQKVLAKLDGVRDKYVAAKLCTRAMTRWACNVVTDTIKAIADVMAAEEFSMIAHRASNWPNEFPPVDEPLPSVWPWQLTDGV